ncbi:hypothetical protein [Seleniivibrio woodruffii]|uniref:Uncharacterized protein n=1 Tax=Seleniivibrio woodruffii TaxID=1078050 RepID=A0A4R1K9F5_9BACT|nr:hypothetical protein [Seleniivibrio woodruffii]TCK60984.1 hypothetical protein C8D98_1865 [Seleniivibrio woodruffii]TVZ36614.1 hypothetical protein OF66_2241 [Seleniivibrio woodruffii]
MLEDTIKSIKAYLYDRTTSPLFGAFITSWVLWNHRFVMAIVFGDGLQEKYDMMDKAICASFLGLLSQWFVLPLLTAILYIFIYPWPARKIYAYTKTQQMKINKLKNEIEGNRLLTTEESRKILIEMSSIQDKSKIESERLNATISALKQELENEKRKNKTMQNNLENEKTKTIYFSSNPPKDNTSKTAIITTNKAINSSQVNQLNEAIKNKTINNVTPPAYDPILVRIAMEKEINENEILSFINKAYNNNTNESKDILEKLIALNMLDKINSSYQLTNTGKDYIIKNRLLKKNMIK